MPRLYDALCIDGLLHLAKSPEDVEALQAKPQPPREECFRKACVGYEAEVVHTLVSITTALAELEVAFECEAHR